MFPALVAGVFLPLTRVHGYQSDTEFWNYGETVTRLAREALNTRYTCSHTSTRRQLVLTGMAAL